MDEIVAAINYEGVVYIFTNTGRVFEMSKGFSGQVEFRIVCQLNLKSI